MASVFICTTPSSEIDYSLAGGRVRSFVLHGKKLYDERDGTAAEGWRGQLVEFVRERGLDVDHDGEGLHAFVHWMRDTGLMPNV